MNISLRGLALPHILVPKIHNLFLVGWIYCSEKAIPEGNKFCVSLPRNSEFFLFLNKHFLFVLIIAAAAALSIQIDHRNMSRAELWHKKRLQVRGFCTISFWFARPSTQASFTALVGCRKSQWSCSLGFNRLHFTAFNHCVAYMFPQNAICSCIYPGLMIFSSTVTCFRQHILLLPVTK
jgi:hypothetical protein